MGGGEVCKDIFFLTKEPTVRKTRLDVPAFTKNQCCFKLPVLAELTGSNDSSNDQSSVLKRYDKNLYSGVILYLQIHNPSDPASVDGWLDVATLFSDDYGTTYGYGTITDSSGNLSYAGYNLEWQKVLVAFGEGTYRVKFEEYRFDATIDDTFGEFEYCLKRYLPHRANCTVRFTWYTKGYRGDFENDLDIWDYTNAGGDGWFNQMRLPDSVFGGNKSNYEREYVRYSNGQQVWISDEQIESYEFHSGMFPALFHDWIKTNILQADRLLVNDYNKNNPNIIVDKEIKPTTSYEPSWNYDNLNAFVTVGFEQAIQNRKKLRC